MKVSEIMSRRVETCGIDDNLATAAKKMSDREVGCLPVLDSDGFLAGILTDRDVCMATYTQNRVPCDIPVSSAMSKNVMSCGPNDSIIDTEVTMISLKIHRLPVLNSEGKLIGIVSLNDLAREADRQSGRQVVRGGYRKSHLDHPRSNVHN